METGANKILSKRVDSVGWLTFNNPERRNAVSLEMWRAATEVLDAFENDTAVRVIVIRGAGGRSFVSGSDISQFDEQRSNAEQQAIFSQSSAAALKRMATLTKPLIAMIQGYCIGGGMRVAGAADIRIASDDSQFGIPAAKLGLGYSFGSIQTLVQLIGPGFTNELLFTARRFNAQEALRIGLVNRVVPAAELEAATQEMALEIARNAPLTVRAAKISVQQAALEPSERNMALVETSIRACFDSQDYAIGRKAFAEKRTPEFTGS